MSKFCKSSFYGKLKFLIFSIVTILSTKKLQSIDNNIGLINRKASQKLRRQMDRSSRENFLVEHL
jgi:hypothetical protein